MPSFCVKCDRLFCSHTLARYEDDRFSRLVRFEPIETTAGEQARQSALAVLVPRHAALDERSRTEFRFTEIELQHMHALEETIDTLRGMAPRETLLPPTEPPRLSPAIP